MVQLKWVAVRKEKGVNKKGQKQSSLSFSFLGVCCSLQNDMLFVFFFMSDTSLSLYTSLHSYCDREKTFAFQLIKESQWEDQGLDCIMGAAASQEENGWMDKNIFIHFSSSFMEFQINK